MDNKPAYRTVITIIALGVLMLVGAFLLRGSDTGAKMYSDLVLGLGLLGGVQGVKSSVQSLAQGGGIAGLKAALLTDAKPGEPAPSTGA